MWLKREPENMTWQHTEESVLCVLKIDGFEEGSDMLYLNIFWQLTIIEDALAVLK